MWVERDRIERFNARRTHIIKVIALVGVILFGSLMPIPLHPVEAETQSSNTQQVAQAPVAETKPEVKPEPVKPVESVTPPAFDPNNSATWPKCATDEIVRADNGQCAKKPAEAPKTAQTAPRSPTQPKAEGVRNCGTDPDQQFIYQHESGCRTWAVNPGGCRGIGQACPGSKLPCGDYDWECQNNWFTNYMRNRYGTWAKARQMWQSRCGSPQGCWW